MGALLLVLVCLSPTSLVSADVPTVLEITREKRGDDTFLVIEVRHGSSTSTHYVDAIEVEKDGKAERISDLEPQTGTRFKVEHAVDPEAEIRVRARCTVHGWSRWAGEEEEEPGGGGGIPGFPYESMALGATLVLLLLWRKSNRG